MLVPYIVLKVFDSLLELCVLHARTIRCVIHNKLAWVGLAEWVTAGGVEEDRSWGLEDDGGEVGGELVDTRGQQVEGVIRSRLNIRPGKTWQAVGLVVARDVAIQQVQG